MRICAAEIRRNTGCARTSNGSPWQPIDISSRSSLTWAGDGGTFGPDLLERLSREEILGAVSRLLLALRGREGGRSWMRGMIFFAGGMTLALAAGWLAFPRVLYQAKRQPLEFNHKLHAGTKVGAKCVDCHSLKAEGRFSGVPALAQCSGCHVAALTESADEKKTDRAVRPRRIARFPGWSIRGSPRMCISPMRIMSRPQGWLASAATARTARARS